jgi:hypothetical protein
VCTIDPGAGGPGAGGAAGCGSVREALRMAGAGLAYLNSPEAAAIDPAAMGEVLTALGDLHAAHDCGKDCQSGSKTPQR